MRLRGMIDLEFGPHERRFTSKFLLAESGVRVELADIEHVMEKHWKGEISDDDLHRWATMLMLNEAYDWEGPDEEKIADTLNELAILPPASEQTC